MRRIRDPREARVCTHGRMSAVNEDDLIPIVLAVACDRIRVENLTIREMLVRALLGDLAVVLVQDHGGAEVLGVPAACEILALVAAGRHALPHDEDALLGTVAQCVGTIKACRVLEPHGRRLATPRDQVLFVDLTQPLLGLLPDLANVVVRPHNVGGDSGTFKKLAMLVLIMKLLVLLATVVGIGLLVTLVSVFFLRPELPAAPTTSSVPTLENATAAPAEPAPATIVVEEFPTPNETKVNVTYEACLAFEQRLLDELEDAQQEFNRRQKDYDRADQNYEDAQDAPVPDKQFIEQLRQERIVAKEARDEAENELESAARRLTKARTECGLPGGQ